MTAQELLVKLEEIRVIQNRKIEDFYPSIGISKTTFHTWKRGATPKGIELTLNIINLLSI
jgi:hypothetical protein